MALGFQEDIRPIFAPYAGCMAGITISTDQGVFPVLLDDYERVKFLHQEIQIAIHGYDEGAETAHPMPPGGQPLPAEDIAKFDQWIEEGMPESQAIA